MIPGYTRVDAAVFWRLNKFTKAQINVENIFGANYYPTPTATTTSPSVRRVRRASC